MTTNNFMEETLKQLRCDVVINQGDINRNIIHNAIESVCVGDDYNKKLSEVDINILSGYNYQNGTYKTELTDIPLQFSKLDSYIYYVGPVFDAEKRNNDYLSVLIPLKNEYYSEGITFILKYLTDNKINGYVRVYKKYKDAIQLKLINTKKVMPKLIDLSKKLSYKQGYINPLSGVNSRMVVVDSVVGFEQEIKEAEHILKLGIENLSNHGKTLYTVSSQELLDSCIEMLPQDSNLAEIFDKLGKKAYVDFGPSIVQNNRVTSYRLKMEKAA